MKPPYVIGPVPSLSGYAARLFLFSFFPCSADHEQDWPPPCKVVFFGLATDQCAECEKQQKV